MSSDDRGRRTIPRLEGDAGPPALSPSQSFWLEYRGHRFELRDTPLVIGRSAGCQLVLDDALVSRRHAQLVIRGSTPTVEDLSSINGVFVNGERVEDACAVKSGDRVVIGKQEMSIRVGPASGREVQRFSAETLTGMEPARIHKDDEEVSESTHQGDALELLGGVADKVLAMGRGDEAERILASFLNNFLLDCKARGTADPETARRAAFYAVKLCGATRRGRWADYAFDLYRVLRRPLPGEAIDKLYEVLRNVTDLKLDGLRSYLAVLKSVQPELGPADRFLTHRIEGLERLMGAR